jgi:hypothetical protein
MSEFSLYLQTGLEHILDPRGYDHILFVISLCVIYTTKDWRKLFWLITAFTLGHSVTLALATLKLVAINSEIIEFLIPATIIFTCFSNFFYTPATVERNHKQISSKTVALRYGVTLFFGLIHGLGFSNFLTSLLGKQSSITLPLLAFNIGLEIGQLAILATVMVLITLLSWLQIKQRDWILVISGIISGIAFTLLIDKWIF